MLETLIIDTGTGISKEKQSFLFVPFKELQYRLGFSKPENENIGLGLSCSKTISNAIGGDSYLKQSKKGLTIFEFKMPVTVIKSNELEELKINTLESLFKFNSPLN